MAEKLKFTTMSKSIESGRDMESRGFTREQSEGMIRMMETLLRIAVLPHIDARFEEMRVETNGRFDQTNGRIDSLEKSQTRVTTIVGIAFGAITLMLAIGFGVMAYTQASLLAQINLLIEQVSLLLGGN